MSESSQFSDAISMDSLADILVERLLWDLLNERKKLRQGLIMTNPLDPHYYHATRSEIAVALRTNQELGEELTMLTHAGLVHPDHPTVQQVILAFDLFYSSCYGCQPRASYFGDPAQREEVSWATVNWSTLESPTCRFQEIGPKGEMDPGDLTEVEEFSRPLVFTWCCTS